MPKCMHEKPLRTQLVASLLGASIPMVAITFVVVLVTAIIVGDQVTQETEKALDSQIARHLHSASAEIAAATEKRFKVMQASLVDPVAYAMRDALESEIDLQDGSVGYPLELPVVGDVGTAAWEFTDADSDALDPADVGSFPGRGMGDHCGVTGGVGTVCSCTEGSAPGICTACRRVAGEGICTLIRKIVSLEKSTVYYAEDGSPGAALTDRDTERLRRSAGIDHWLPALYQRHTAAQMVYVGLEMQDLNTGPIRTYPSPAEHEAGSGGLYSCDKVGSEAHCTGSQTCLDDFAALTVEQKRDAVNCPTGCDYIRGQCYDAKIRGWYTAATAAGRHRMNNVNGLGKSVVTEPYQDAGSGDWMVTLARAIYPDGRPDSELLGVAATDVLLTSVRDSILAFKMLDTGFAMLVDARSSSLAIVAAPVSVYNPCPENTLAAGQTTGFDRDGNICTQTKTICELMPTLCAGAGAPFSGSGSTNTCASLNPKGNEGDDDKEFAIVEHNIGGNVVELVWQGGCVETEERGVLTHAVLVMVPKTEIRAPVSGVTEKLEESQELRMTVVSVLSVVTLILISVKLLHLATVITKPIEIMSKVASDITQDVYDDDEEGAASNAKHLKKLHETDPAQDEIGDLLKEFISMVTGMNSESEAQKAKNEAAQQVDPKAKYPPNPVTSLTADAPETGVPVSAGGGGAIEGGGGIEDASKVEMPSLVSAPVAVVTPAEGEPLAQKKRLEAP